MSNCATPKTCLYDSEWIDKTSTKNAVRVVCSNDSCSRGSWMHSLCFEIFEDSLLDLLHEGNNRSLRVEGSLWSQNNEFLRKISKCLCGQGYLRKDVSSSQNYPILESKKKKRKGIKNPSLRLLSLLSSQTNSSLSKCNRSYEQQSSFPRNRTNSISSNTSGSSVSSSSAGDFTPYEFSKYDRRRHDSGGSIFLRRVDYSSFNILPKHKINSYHIKIEDECSIGNDETRIFILSSFASNKMNKAPCVLCKKSLVIFDRYPLIDGTFFLSPRQHNTSCIQVKTNGKKNYMTAVCMSCLEGWSGICCRFCRKPWAGAHLILGTMYSYDIFAATPCCQEKLKCNHCYQYVIHPHQRFNFFSDYSQILSCPHCGNTDAHFAKKVQNFVQTEDSKSFSSLTPSTPFGL